MRRTMMALRMAKLGVSSRWRSRMPVTGQVRLPCTQQGGSECSQRALSTLCGALPMVIYGAALCQRLNRQQHRFAAPGRASARCRRGRRCARSRP